MNIPKLPKDFATAAAAVERQRDIPKVSFAVPCYGPMPADTAFSMVGICAYSLGRARIMAWKSDRSPTASARNDLAKRSIEAGAEWIFWMDSDMTAPADALVRLLSHNVDIVGAMYNKRLPPYTTVGGFVGQPDYAKRGLQEASHLGFGLILTRASVFHKIANPWFEHRTGVPELVKPDNPFGEEGEDVGFCRKAQAAGLKVWCDLDLTFDPAMGHIGSHTVRITPPEVAGG